MSYHTLDDILKMQRKSKNFSVNLFLKFKADPILGDEHGALMEETNAYSMAHPEWIFNTTESARDLASMFKVDGYYKVSQEAKRKRGNLLELSFQFKARYPMSVHDVAMHIERTSRRYIENEAPGTFAVAMHGDDTYSYGHWSISFTHSVIDNGWNTPEERASIQINTPNSRMGSTSAPHVYGHSRASIEMERRENGKTLGIQTPQLNKKEIQNRPIALLKLKNIFSHIKIKSIKLNV